MSAIRESWKFLVAWMYAHRFAVVSLIALVVFLYAPTINFDFVNWDDPWYVTENPLIESWSPSNLYEIATAVVIRNYAPLTIFSYLLDHTIFGEWAGGYHLTNLLLHAVNAVLVFALISRLTGSPFIAWGTAALFAVHPVQVESVAWIASRKGLISTGFLLAAMLCWLRPVRTGRQEAAGLVFLALALLAKVIAIVAPAIVLVYDMWVLRKRFSDALARQVIPGFLAICMLLVNMSAQTSELGGVRAHLSLGKPYLLAVDLTILWQYVGMLVFPYDLCVLYDPPTSGIAWLIIASAIGWAMAVAVIWKVGRTQPLVPWAAVSALFMLLPVLNLFPLTTLMNDRYLYLPSIPFFAVMLGGLRYVALQGAKLFERQWGRVANIQMLRDCGFAGLFAVLVAYACGTASYLPVWRDSLSLWHHAVTQVPQLPVVRIQLANTLHARGEDRIAVSLLESTLAECRPDRLDERRIEQKLIAWRAK